MINSFLKNVSIIYIVCLSIRYFLEFSGVDCERKCCISSIMPHILARVSGFFSVELHVAQERANLKEKNEGI